MFSFVRNSVKPVIYKLLDQAWQLKPNEKLLIVTDYPPVEDVPKIDIQLLDSMIQRALFSRIVYEIALEKYPKQVELYYYKPTYKHYQTPDDPELLQKIEECDILFSLNEFSLTGIPLTRKLLEQKKIKHVSAPLISPETFFIDGPIDIDFYKIEEVTSRLYELLYSAERIEVRDFTGSKLIIEDFKKACWTYESGMLSEKGMLTNLPAGEVVVDLDVPGYESCKMDGVLNIFPGWEEDITENLQLTIKDTRIVDITGGGKMGNKLKELSYRSEMQIVQFGIGTNPKARDPLCPTLADKFIGMAHVAISPKNELRHFYFPVSYIKVDDKEYSRLELFENVLGLET